MKRWIIAMAAAALSLGLATCAGWILWLETHARPACPPPMIEIRTPAGALCRPLSDLRHISDRAISLRDTTISAPFVVVLQ